MIKLIAIFLIIACFSASTTAISGECVGSGKITEMFQWDDGHIFLVLDKNTNCNCKIRNRVGFHKNLKDVFFISGALGAFLSGKTIHVWADDACTVHANTARPPNSQLPNKVVTHSSNPYD